MLDLIFRKYRSYHSFVIILIDSTYLAVCREYQFCNVKRYSDGIQIFLDTICQNSENIRRLL